MFKERMILYANHEFPDAYHKGHIVLTIHPDYILRFTHVVNQERLGTIQKLSSGRYKLTVSEFHSFQDVLAWISNLEGNPDSIPELYIPEPEPFLARRLPDKYTTFDREMDTTRIVFWMIIVATILIVMVGNWLF